MNSTKKNSLSVRLNGLEIGTLQLANGKMEFSYNDKAKYPISLSLPLQKESPKEPYKEKVCRAYFGGLLPENPNMREMLAKKYKININNDFRLLEAIGRDCAGAISFHKPDEVEKEINFVELKGNVLSDSELKKHIEELPYRPYMGSRISLAGAQEKTAVCLINNQIAIPDVDIPTTHIIKTALPKYRESIQNEYICMKTAKAVGIEVPEVEIKHIGNVEFLLLKRFDREFKDDNVVFQDDVHHIAFQHRLPYKIKRILQEDFAQSLGIQSKNKYNVVFKDCLWVLNQTSTPAKSKLEFVKRVIFNYLIGNTDAHSKNFSIFLNDGRIEMTPAYDLLCSSIYDCNQRIAMKIGKARFYKEVTDKDWQLFASDIDISYKVVQKELSRQKEIIVSIVEEIAKELNCEVGNKILEYVKSQIQGV